ncbi:hypothetical protein A2291_01195 [candidate division WOR-1 bacterium RIFOXYB2_FULL_42_35]|uniref:Uncharacterized protein n=1 Tax=candidate division WOR-1 bacterium RIFOXYC2_FULL_41_25 TaxID=1802586 RepID=A0A1F4TL21_UNCSA|nr:MAG: hypothetical protein A2247_04620 [candidate division WOR-1 bacterium RIFOXYA2_FULL_41_14]OGC22924.1 MAG: hypothetical protein A2291_01195 [candidate division WOR-1 bacterium RIFOXYB2_FULL_42_35]OGC33405.1 MAG: hypothetical protein A2462_06585 [candidate division WOR-1 bacterium RIFOXYC2_FULL_41_25]
MFKQAIWLALLLIGLTLILTPTAQALTVGDWGGWATVGTKLADKVSGCVGFSVFGGTTSTTWLLAKVDYDLVKPGKLQTKAGIFYWLTSPRFRDTLRLYLGRFCNGPG